MSIATIAQPTSVPGGTAVNLGRNAVWENEWSWTPVMQSVKRALDGVVVVEFITPNTNIGRTITLRLGWLRRSQVDGVITLRDEEAQSGLKLILVDAREFAVLFDHNINHGVEINPILERPDYINQVSPDWYNCKVHFVVIDTVIPAAYVYSGPEEPDA
jgi:hypothetical protein